MKTEEIIIEVAASRKQELLKILEDINFIRIQTKESVLNDFIKSAPADVSLTEEELDDLVFEERYARRNSPKE
ncbi:MAG TPA: hypothetical protein PLD84_11995 [Chitinophagales bacterium]|nr:hypothetical protein [Chitinophagales bacterium]